MKPVRHIEREEVAADQPLIAIGNAGYRITLHCLTRFTLLHPFEDYDVIAGQGSCGVEIAEQLVERGIDPAAVRGHP